jgi:hypothetical protein
LIALPPRKFAGVNYNLPYTLRSRVCFEDAETEPMPRNARPLEVGRCQVFFQSEVRKIAKASL